MKLILKDTSRLSSGGEPVEVDKSSSSEPEIKMSLNTQRIRLLPARYTRATAGTQACASLTAHVQSKEDNQRDDAHRSEEQVLACRGDKILRPRHAGRKLKLSLTASAPVFLPRQTQSFDLLVLLLFMKSFETAELLPTQHGVRLFHVPVTHLAQL